MNVSKPTIARAGYECQVKVLRKSASGDSCWLCCGRSASVVLENWAGRTECLCDAHALELLADLKKCLKLE